MGAGGVRLPVSAESRRAHAQRGIRKIGDGREDRIRIHAIGGPEHNKAVLVQALEVRLGHLVGCPIRC